MALSFPFRGQDGSKKTIEFYTDIKGLEEFAPVQPGNNFIPTWFKECPAKVHPTHDITEFGTVKTCPAMMDWFSLGFVIPMWCDTILRYDKKDNKWSWNTPSKKYTWDVHDRAQFLNHAPSWVGDEIGMTFKAICPWYAKTPPGYSLIQQPMFYHFNRSYTVLPGILDTDFHHELNQQVMFHTNEKKEITIKRGTPLARYIPIKREIFEMDMHTRTEKEQAEMEHNTNEIFSKFRGAYKIRRVRMKEKGEYYED